MQTSAAPTQTKPFTAAEKADVREATVGASKIVVAIHGIGDQYENATIQTVVSAFGKFARYPAMMPLGRFRGGGKAVQAFRLKGPPDPGKPLGDIGFVEVYWADIPREAQVKGYIIEESKAWARTVVERVRARFSACAENLDAAGPQRGQRLRLRLEHEDYLAGADAIEEMIQTFQVLDNLLFIAEKAGVLKFDLGTLLTRYLGDVQIVADFADYRQSILDKFRQTLREIQQANEQAEIYIVAHSEGTVVAWMGLLEAMSVPLGPDGQPSPAPDPPAWVGQVRGFMTIGSPIDKHLILWPDIWDAVQKPHPRLAAIRSDSATKQIQWRNYYDYGDPVGFKLDTARDWIDAHEWLEFFDFPETHDHGFGRYLLPGAAHNDYWTDEAVFGHFIQTVMKLPAAAGESFANPPADRRLNRLGSNVIPYAVVLAIIYLGVYLLYKGVVAYATPANGHGITVLHLVRNVSGITALLAGMIALARIPRLTRSAGMFAAAAGIFAIGAVLYGFLVTPDVHRWHALQLFNHGNWLHRQLTGWIAPDWRIAAQQHGINSAYVSNIFIIVLSAAISFFAAWGSRQKLQTWTKEPLATLRQFFKGARPLVLPGAAWVLIVVAYRVIKPAPEDAPSNPLWPLILASGAFLYLWWLATLIFDLVFVWHRYIRHSVAHNYLYALRRARKKSNPPAREKA